MGRINAKLAGWVPSGSKPAMRHVVTLGLACLALVLTVRGTDKAELTRKLGAHDYVDSRAENVAERLTAMGGAALILATVTSAEAMSAVIDGLAVNGKLLVVGASAEPIEVSPLQLIGGRRSIQGWPSGVAADSEDTLAFSALYEIMEMVVATMVAPGTGDAWLGTQGDIWDPQKDMGLAALGAAVCMSVTALMRKLRTPRPVLLAGEKL